MGSTAVKGGGERQSGEAEYQEEPVFLLQLHRKQVLLLFTAKRTASIQRNKTNKYFMKTKTYLDLSNY